MWKVLIADDEPKIRQGLKSVLEEMKLPITVCAEARNGMEALENKDPLDILAYQYDLVCNGYEMASGAVRNHDPKLMVKAFEIAGYSEKTVEEKRSFEEVQQEAKELWNKLVEENPDNAKRIMKKVEMTFGRPMKLSEITEDQQDLFELVIMEMKTL